MEYLNVQDFEDAKVRLDEIINHTDLLHSEFFSREFGNEVYLKMENLQKTGSFKVRGAYNKMSKLTEEEKTRGVVTSSAGNHAQGVALSSQKLGVKASICMPLATPLIKVNATKAYGANAILVGDVYDDAYAHAKILQETEGYTMVHPFNDVDVIEGQGTIAVEILRDLPDVDIILAPIGGGGLISGVAAYAKQKNPNVQVIGVEPSGAASATLALQNGSPCDAQTCVTIADGTAVRKIGQINYNYIRKFVDDIITVSDYELMDSFLIMVEKHKMIAENSGILPIAALKKMHHKGKKIACVVSGGNIDVMSISSIINKGLVSRGRIFTFSVNLPDKPGQIMNVSKILSELNANIVRISHNKFVNLTSFDELELVVTVQTSGFEHIQQIANIMFQNGYKIRNYS